MIEIDGAYGEGGGQVLRTALTLSALTGQPARVYNIRVGRCNPGLAPQHLAGVLALAQICEAEVEGVAVESQEVLFRPTSKPRNGEYTFDVAQMAGRGSAGSVTLIFQTLLLPLAFAGASSHVTLLGGTHVAWSPPFEYLAHVYLPMAGRMGIKAECRLDTPGFYPQGGGKMGTTIFRVGHQVEKGEAGTKPEKRVGLTSLSLLERGELRGVWGVAMVSNLPAHIPQRMSNRGTNLFKQEGIQARIQAVRKGGRGPGAGVFLVAEYEGVLAGFSSLGKKGKPSERVAEEVFEEFLLHHQNGAPVDRYLADQLVLPMALAEGDSTFRTSCLTRHLLTNAYVIEQFIPAKISIEGNEGEEGEVRIEGMSYPKESR
ncbi:MAG: RNA 3'-terminal phosphate cyclase [Chloroflexota bacterium]